ncbi:MAG: alanine--tRNA ligase [Gammaproteobacteria bacterium]|nr:MAG: alanine--tRNA ligase [Gammaproteobacteria bacterium]
MSTIPYMTTSEIRQKFLNYFAKNQHQILNSSSLVPGNDPTLLFTNAGMVQFKDLFLGTEKRDYQRATTSQRCVRAGGKHNDLDNVGYTARHHTFFEMLGNFSFGDYFKEQAIQLAWEFLTVELGLPKEKLWVTVYKDDLEAEKIWFDKIGIDQNKFSRLGEKDNFWSMGDTGPCGPCSEIFFDHGEDVPGGPPGSPDEEGDRYIEIWNLVFMQFERSADGSQTNLPNPSIDTGMGLERVAAIMQGVHSNYQIDLFSNLINSITTITGIENKGQASLNVIADHIRSCAFLICDGVIPSNEGRGYVLRRIIRRAIRHGHKLGVADVFFYKLVASLVKEMGEAYPELFKQQATIELLLKREEQQFLKTLEKGLKILDQAVEELASSELSGDVVFKLYDTYGFPYDLTADIARERDLTIDSQGFESAMDNQRQMARAASKFALDEGQKIDLDGHSDFSGYENTSDVGKVTYLATDSSQEVIQQGDKAIIILNKTPFYAESGGQVGDTGLIKSSKGVFKVTDTQKSGEHFVHTGQVISGSFEISDEVSTDINAKQRKAITANHSATHLMHAALQSVLGDHVAQKGSLVDANRLRFDFSHLDMVTKQELREIELVVNQQIRDNHEVTTNIMTPEEAQKDGATALFGEKYGDKVRVLTMGIFSKELCGGTHVSRTGDIGLFRITSETGIAAGVRRIEGVAGEAAIKWTLEQESYLNQVSLLLRTDSIHTYEKVQQALKRTRSLEKDIEKLNARLASGKGNDLMSSAKSYGDISVLITRLDDIEPKALRDTVDQLKNKLQKGIVAIATTNKSKVSLIVGVTKDLTDRFNAGKLVNQLAVKVGGKGGGRPDMAQAGGNQPEYLDDALKELRHWFDDELG